MFTTSQETCKSLHLCLFEFNYTLALWYKVGLESEKLKNCVLSSASSLEVFTRLELNNSTTYYIIAIFC